MVRFQGFLGVVVGLGVVGLGWVGEVVFPVEVDVFVDGRREMCKVVPGDLGSCFGEVSDGGFGVDGVPGEEGYAFALEVLVFGASASQLPWLAKTSCRRRAWMVSPLLSWVWIRLQCCSSWR